MRFTVSSSKSTPCPIDLTNVSLEIHDSLYPLLKNIIREQEYLAGIFCYKGKDDDNLFKVLLSFEIPAEPFNGTNNKALNNFINDCYNTYPTPHIHSAKDSDFWKGLSSLYKTDEWFKRVVFVPFQGEGLHFVFLFFGDQHSIKKVNQGLIDSATLIASSALAFLNYETIKKNHKVMEYYVKEVGHDISSSVQAIIAKVRNVRRGLVTGKTAEKKLEEAEGEIMATHRVADTLGIAVDPDYNIRSGNDFDLTQTIEAVINLCASEAEERHSQLEVEVPDHPVNIWGDNKAIESAITQYVINAIKYCHGGSKITVQVNDQGRFVDVAVVNIGIPLDDDIKQRMWGFGERGKRALEHHVNGSGIGLYTVNKIVKAHAGEVYFRTDRTNTGVAVFGFKIPRENVLAKSKLL